MAKVREVRFFTIQQAMDNLAAIMAIDLENPPKLGILQKYRLVTEADQTGPHEIFWLSGEGTEPIFEILDMTFHTIHRHFVNLLESSEVNWDDPKVRKGVQALAVLAGEAAHKMNEYLAIRLGKPLAQKIEERPSYQELEFFYQHRFQSFLKGGGESWKQDWEENEEAAGLTYSKTGLKDFEVVKRDLEYELFMIRNQDANSYFNEPLLQNIKLVCDFDPTKGLLEDDPLLRLRALQDRDVQASAQQILHECQDLIRVFYQKASKIIPEISFAKELSMALTALMLTSNPRNLIQNSSGKSSLDYFHDFHGFLRGALNSDECQKYIAYPPEKGDKIPHLLLNLAYGLSKSFFERLGGIRQEVVGLIHRCMRKGEEKNRKTAIKGESFCSQLLIEDNRYRAYLDQFPNGPLFKILDLVRTHNPDEMVFDPILQDNFPQKICDLLVGSQKVSILRLPCPTRQQFINKAPIDNEFCAFLRALGSQKKKGKHLLINLQDRTSWQEYARSRSMELLQKSAEFNETIATVTLPKNTDFYYQNSEYLNSNIAKDFIEQFKAQVLSGEDCGYFFPSEVPIQGFMDKALPLIHKVFFESKSNLTRQNREDFVEIFYQLLILKLIEVIEPDSLSFTCKDAVDTGAAQLAIFAGLVFVMNDRLDKEGDFLRWILYAPALFVRERAIDPERLDRALCVLDRFNECKDLASALSGLYQPKFLKNISLKHF